MRRSSSRVGIITRRATRQSKETIHPNQSAEAVGLDNSSKNELGWWDRLVSVIYVHRYFEKWYWILYRAESQHSL